MVLPPYELDDMCALSFGFGFGFGTGFWARCSESDLIVAERPF